MGRKYPVTRQPATRTVAGNRRARVADCAVGSLPAGSWPHLTTVPGRAVAIACENLTQSGRVVLPPPIRRFDYVGRHATPHPRPLYYLPLPSAVKKKHTRGELPCQGYSAERRGSIRLRVRLASGVGRLSAGESVEHRQGGEHAEPDGERPEHIAPSKAVAQGNCSGTRFRMGKGFVRTPNGRNRAESGGKGRFRPPLGLERTKALRHLCFPHAEIAP